VAVGNVLNKLSNVLTPLSIGLNAIDTYRDIQENGADSFAVQARAVGRIIDVGFSVHPVTRAPTAAFKVGKATGDLLFAPGQPLSPVIEGGVVNLPVAGKTYIPGLGDFTKDVVLDFGQNTKTVVNAAGAGINAASKWIGNKWKSLW
jgi:hypothetical protein